MKWTYDWLKEYLRIINYRVLSSVERGFFIEQLINRSNFHL